MAWKNMDVAPSYGNTNNHVPAYEAEVNLAAGGSSDSIMIPNDVQNLSITIHFAGGGTGRVDVSNDSVYTVKTGAPAWTAQAVAAGTDALINMIPCTAIKAVQVHAGTMKMVVRAQ